MTDSMFFKEAKLGYDKEEIHRFLRRLNEEHEYTLSIKDDEMKNLVNEKTVAEENYQRQIQELQGLLREKEAENAENAGKYEEVCTKIGEKLLFAERQSSAIIAAAEETGRAIEREAKQRTEVMLAELAAKTEKDVDSALKAAELLRQKSQVISDGIDRMRQTVVEAVMQIAKAAE